MVPGVSVEVHLKEMLDLKFKSSCFNFFLFKVVITVILISVVISTKNAGCLNAMQQEHAGKSHTE